MIFWGNYTSDLLTVAYIMGIHQTSDTKHTHTHIHTRCSRILQWLRLQWPVMLSIWLSIATASQWPRDHSNANTWTHTHTHTHTHSAFYHKHNTTLFGHLQLLSITQTQSRYKHTYIYINTAQKPHSIPQELFTQIACALQPKKHTVRRPDLHW